MTESQNLLADYAQTGPEETFRELLTRYIDLVYSSAVRLVGNDAELAKDVTQTVLPRPSSNSVSFAPWRWEGWLGTCSTFTASAPSPPPKKGSLRWHQERLTTKY